MKTISCIFNRKHLLGVGLSCISLAAAAATAPTHHLLSTPIVTNLQNSKIGQHLQQAMQASQTVSHILSNQKILANIQLTHIPSNLKEQLAAFNIKITSISKEYNQVAVELNQNSKVSALVKLPSVLHISEVPGSGSGTGSAYNDSVNALNVNKLTRLMPNITGKGVRIGIISTSFAHSSHVRGVYTTPAKCKSGTLENAKDQMTGDLPAKIDLRNDACVNSGSEMNSDEGAAMAEVVHDVAPGASISFYGAGNTQADMVKAINDLCTSKANGGAGADIVIDDAYFSNEPYYQEGIINQAIQHCVHKGVMYMTAAGNDVNRSYQFKYKDIDPSVRDPHPSTGSKTTYGDDFQKWPNGSAFMPITIPAKGTLLADLTWNQPYISFEKKKVNFPLIDFDLYLLSKNASTSKMQVITSSTNHQGQGIYNNPFESVYYENSSSSAKTVYLAVNHWSGNTKTIPQDRNIPVLLDLQFPQPTADGTTFGVKFNAPVMNGHTWTQGAISVEAIHYYQSAPYVSQSEARDAFENSVGGLNHQFYFNLAGDVSLSTRSGPTLSGVDDGDNTFFGFWPTVSDNMAGEPDGFPNYYGTSAATPSIAGVAALLKQYAGPGVPNQLIRRALVNTARDIYSGRATKGWDPVTGAGEVDAVAAFNYLKKELGRH